VVTRLPPVLGYSIEDGMMPRVQYLKDIGVKEDDIGKVVTRLPPVLGLSVENNLKPTYEYLRENFNVNVENIVADPILLSFSLNNRIKPRYEFLKSKEIQGRYSVSTVLKSSDEKFCNLLKVPLQEYLDFKDQYLQRSKEPAPN